MATKESHASLIAEGLAEVERRYGMTGISPKLYHGLEHTLEVREAGLQIGRLAVERGKILLEDLPLIDLATCWHDAFRDAPPGEAERISARMLVDRMKRTGEFSLDAMSKVGSMIVGTTVKLVGNTVIQLTGDDYPSKILADADLSALGKPFDVFEPAMLRFYRELHENPSAVPDESFLRGEIELLESHEFFTEEARELFPHQTQNAQCIRGQLAA